MAAKCTLEKVNRGLTPSVEYLANCSTMKKIVRMAAKMLSDQDHKTATKQEKEQAAREHAAYIIDGLCKDGIISQSLYERATLY